MNDEQSNEPANLPLSFDFYPTEPAVLLYHSNVAQITHGTAALYGRAPPIVVTDGANYGPVFTKLGVTRIIRRHSIRNRVERWIQELKRRIDIFYSSFTGDDVVTTNNWLRQFSWVWNTCPS